MDRPRSVKSHGTLNKSSIPPAPTSSRAPQTTHALSIGSPATAGAHTHLPPPIIASPGPSTTSTASPPTKKAKTQSRSYTKKHSDEVVRPPHPIPASPGPSSTSTAPSPPKKAKLQPSPPLLPPPSNTLPSLAPEQESEQPPKPRKYKKHNVDTAFKQQRYKGLKQKPRFLTPYCLAAGFVMLPIGIGLFFYSYLFMHEKILDYTNCISLDNKSRTCAEEVKTWNLSDPERSLMPCRCEYNFTLEYDYMAQVYVYYGLTNFYQNHRWYAGSKDDKQLDGSNTGSPSYDCHPFHNVSGKWIWPCGSLANSMFQDEFNLYAVQDTKKVSIPLVFPGGIWKSDKQYIFKNPHNWTATYFKSQTNFVKPLAWLKSPFELDPSNPQNNGVQNEDFIRWMKISPKPTLRKLYRKVQHKKRKNETTISGKGGLAKGNYSFDIKYSFRPTTGGRKTIILATTSKIFGNKNPYIAVGCLSVGGLALLVGLSSLIGRRCKEWFKSRRRKERRAMGQPSRGSMEQQMLELMKERLPPEAKKDHVVNVFVVNGPDPSIITNRKTKSATTVT